MNIFYCHWGIVMLSLSLGARTTDFKLRLKSFQPKKFHITVVTASQREIDKLSQIQHTHLSLHFRLLKFPPESRLHIVYLLNCSSKRYCISHPLSFFNTIIFIIIIAIIYWSEDWMNRLAEKSLLWTSFICSNLDVTSVRSNPGKTQDFSVKQKSICAI